MPLQGAIDVDRGVTIRQIVRFDRINDKKFEGDPKYGGMTVYMYKDEPGIYYDVHGNKVADALAKRAGFPTDRLAKMKAKRDALAAFSDKLRRELEIETNDEEVILAESGNWKVVGLPMDRARVVDKETGEPVTPVAQSRSDAISLLEELVGAEAEATEISNAAKGKANGRTSS